MKIDWLVRIKNPYFWIGLFALFISTLNIDLSKMTDWHMLYGEIIIFVKSPFLVFSFIVAFIGYINNPTTKGLSDGGEKI